MKDSVDFKDPILSELLNTEINATFRKGAFYASCLSLFGAVAIFLSMFFGLAHDFFIPGIWAIFCWVFCIGVYIFARNGLIRDVLRYFIIFPFVSLPTIIYIISFFTLPAGTATYITGPPSYLYLFVIVMTGFLFDSRISVLAGAFVAIQYLAIYFASASELAKVSHPDPLMQQDIAGFPMYFLKASVMLFTGIVVGTLSKTAKRLIGKAIIEEEAKKNLDRLFGQYVSSEIKNKIILEKKDVIGERKTIAILFSDIRSFSTISETMEPEEIVRRLNRYFDRMVKAINRHGGVIDKFIGDAIMANFGGVLPLENPCDSAVRAAIEMRGELGALNGEWKTEGIDPFENGIGIHYGDALQGTVGSTDRKEFTVIGDSVNTASRLESLTKELHTPILISQSVYEQLSESMRTEWTNLGESSVKGKQQRVCVYGRQEKAK